MMATETWIYMQAALILYLHHINIPVHNENGEILKMLHMMAGLRHSGNESSAAFADFDDDGFLDLFITRKEEICCTGIRENELLLMLPIKPGWHKKAGIKLFFFDLDHDGDLDLIRDDIRY